MALGITASHSSFQATVARVDTAADQLRDDRDLVSHRVETLLDGGWSGAAATAYSDGWAEWRAGADQVLAALETMAGLLRAVDLDLTDTDGGAAVSFSRLAERLG